VETHQHYQLYNQEYNFPELDTLFAPPRAIELIPEADPKHRQRRRGTQSGRRGRLRRRAHHRPLPSILLANVQSLYNKVDELRRGFLSRETSGIVTYSVSRKHGYTV
jgi:hypothetical protein